MVDWTETGTETPDERFARVMSLAQLAVAKGGYGVTVPSGDSALFAQIYEGLLTGQLVESEARLTAQVEDALFIERARADADAETVRLQNVEAARAAAGATTTATSYDPRVDATLADRNRAATVHGFAEYYRANPVDGHPEYGTEEGMSQWIRDNPQPVAESWLAVNPGIFQPLAPDAQFATAPAPKHGNLAVWASMAALLLFL